MVVIHYFEFAVDISIVWILCSAKVSLQERFVVMVVRSIENKISSSIEHTPQYCIDISM